MLASGEIFFYDPKTFGWQIFAEGLHNPLGVIAESNSSLVISQRPEVTRVSDTNGDGRADFYQVMSDEFGMSGNYHEFHFTPVKDKEGNYFFSLGTGSSGDGIRPIVRGEFDPRGRPGRMHSSTPFRGCVMKLTKDGETIPWSYGHRTPNGLGFDLEGNLLSPTTRAIGLVQVNCSMLKRGASTAMLPVLLGSPDLKVLPWRPIPKTLPRCEPAPPSCFLTDLWLTLQPKF